MAIATRKVSWILDADINKFFDYINHRYLLKCLMDRIADNRMLKLIKRMLKAGVLYDSEWERG
jgi:retron-type reverse transcriptase